MRSHLENTAVSGVIPSFLLWFSLPTSVVTVGGSSAAASQGDPWHTHLRVWTSQPSFLLETGVWLRICFLNQPFPRQGISRGKTFGQHLGSWVPSFLLWYTCASLSLISFVMLCVARTLVCEKDLQYLHSWIQIALKEHALQRDVCWALTFYYVHGARVTRWRTASKHSPNWFNSADLMVVCGLERLQHGFYSLPEDLINLMQNTHSVTVCTLLLFNE